MKSVCTKYLTDENCKCKFEDCFCKKMFKMEYLFNEALLTDRQKQHVNIILDNDADRPAFNTLSRWSENVDKYVKNGYNLYIHSNTCGNGKTLWSIRLIQKFFDKIWKTTDLRCRALFINVPRYLLSVKDNISNKNQYAESINKNIYSADLVVWDDIGTKAITQYESEILLNIIDTRINEGKSNIFTSNMNEAALYELLGNRLASRIVGLSDDVEFFGPDKRGMVK